MKPIFFPFTHLTKFDVDSILNYFESFSYLSTSSIDELKTSEPDWFQTLWKEKRYIEPIALTNEELLPIVSSIKSWKTWADANYGKQTKQGYLKSIFRENPYFTSDNNIFSIRSQIEKGVTHINHINNSILSNKSLVFLRLAAISDRDNEDVDQKLSSINKLEETLFAELKGGLDDDSFYQTGSQFENNNKIPLMVDRGGTMTEERFRAWLSLFLTKKSQFKELSSNIFVTTSKAVINFLISVSENSKLMLDIDNLKMHKEKKSNSIADADCGLFQISGQIMENIIAFF